MRHHDDGILRRRSNLPRAFIERRRSEPVLQFLLDAVLEPEAVLSALGTKPHALFGAEVVEMRANLVFLDIAAVEEAEADSVGAVAGRGHHSPLPPRRDGHASPLVIGQFDHFGVPG